jgi:hypothetical protein
MFNTKKIQFEGGAIGLEIDFVIEKDVPAYGDMGYDFALAICDAFNVPSEKIDEIKSMSGFIDAYEKFLSEVRQLSEDVEIDTMLDSLNTEG